MATFILNYKLIKLHETLFVHCDNFGEILLILVKIIVKIFINLNLDEIFLNEKNYI